MAVELDVWSGTYRLVEDPHVQEIPADAVPADTRALSEGVLEIARTELGLGPDVRLRWFSDESETSKRLRRKHGAKGLPWVAFEADARTSGVTFGAAPSELWIRSTLDPLDAAEAVFHESRHAAQYADFLAGKGSALNMTGSSPCADRLAEVDARLWAREITGRLEAEAEERAVALVAADTESRRFSTRRSSTPAEAAMTERRERMYEIRGRRYLDCERCAEAVAVGTVHRCPAAAAWRPR